jgi:hypothetical protein
MDCSSLELFSVFFTILSAWRNAVLRPMGFFSCACSRYSARKFDALMIGHHFSVSAL